MDEFKSSTKSAEGEKTETETIDNKQLATTIDNTNHDDSLQNLQSIALTNKKPARRRRLAHRRQYAKSRRVASSFLRSQFVRYDILSRKFHDEDATFDDWYKVQTIDSDCPRTTTNNNLENDASHGPRLGQLKHSSNLQLDNYSHQARIKPSGGVDARYSSSQWDQYNQQQQILLSQTNHLEKASKSDEIDLNSEQDDSSKSSIKIPYRSPIDPSTSITQHVHQRHLSGNVYFANYNSSSLDSSYSVATDENVNLTDPLTLSPRQPRTSPMASIPNLSPNYVASFETGDDVRNIISTHLQQQQQHKQTKLQPQTQSKSRRQLPATSNQHLVKETTQPNLPTERVVRSETIDLNQVGWRPDSPKSKKFFPSTSFNLRDRQQLSQFDLSNVGPKVVCVNRFVSMQRLDNQELSRQKQAHREETREVSLSST